MSLAISTLLLAGSAAAQLTTSFWMPGGYETSGLSFDASVVDVKDDKTTLAIALADGVNTDDLYILSAGSETITLQGSTLFESVVTTTDAFEEGDATYSIGCRSPTQARAKPACTYSIQGLLAYKQYCSDYSSYSDVYTTSYEYTYDGFGTTSTETIVETVDYRTYIPDFCLGGGSTLPESFAVNTVTMSASDIATYQLVITAGEEKLGATAGSTPSGTNAQATGTQKPATTRSDGSTPTAAAAAPENTGAAPMITAAPIVAGLGAAMAAFIL